VAASNKCLPCELREHPLAVPERSAEAFSVCGDLVDEWGSELELFESDRGHSRIGTAGKQRGPRGRWAQ
jgi:hypothetical protein